MSCYISSRKKNRKEIRYKRHGWIYIKGYGCIMDDKIINYFKQKNNVILGENLNIPEMKIEWISGVKK